MYSLWKLYNWKLSEFNAKMKTCRGEEEQKEKEKQCARGKERLIYFLKCVANVKRSKNSIWHESCAEI